MPKNDRGHARDDRTVNAMTTDSQHQPAAHPDDRGTATCRIEPRADGEVAWVTLGHSAKMNAMGSAMMTELMAILKDLENRQDLRVVVISGAGSRAFVGGAFVPELFSLTPETSRAFIYRMHRVFQAVRQCPVPVIAMIRGYCLGAGTELAAACDIRIADTSAVFGMPEVKVGMPSLIEAALLPMIVGWGKTREMLMTGANYSAAEGKEMGFFEAVCEEAELDSTIERKIGQIVAAGRQAVRAQKKLINAWEELKPSERIALSMDYMEAAFASGEPHRMMAPFVRKKPR